MNSECENQCWRCYHEGAVVSFLVEKRGLKEEKCHCDDFWTCKESCKDCLKEKKSLKEELNKFLSTSFPREVDGYQLTSLGVTEGAFVRIMQPYRSYSDFVLYYKAYSGGYKAQASVLKHIMLILDHEDPWDRDYCVHEFLDRIDYEVLVEMKTKESLVELAYIFLPRMGSRYFNFEETLKLPKRQLYAKLSHNDATVILAMKAVIDYRRTTPGYMDERLIR